MPSHAVFVFFVFVFCFQANFPPKTKQTHSPTYLNKTLYILFCPFQDKFHKLLTIIPKLNGEGLGDLVSPTRELVKEGAITKISARSGEKQARYIFLVRQMITDDYL